MSYVVAFGLTLLIEVPIYAAVLRRLMRHAWVAGAAINVATHPWVWLLLVPGRGWLVWLAVEIVAWLVEFGLLLLWIRRSPAVLLGVAVLANISSALVGLVW